MLDSSYLADATQQLVQRWFEISTKSLEEQKQLIEDTELLTLSINSSNDLNNEKIKKIYTAAIKEISNHNVNEFKQLASCLSKNTIYKRGVELKGAFVPLHNFLLSIINIANINIENIPNINSKHEGIELKNLEEFDTNLLYYISTGKILSYAKKDLGELLVETPKDRETINKELIRRLNDEEITFEELGIEKDEHFLTNVVNLFGNQCSQIHFLEFPKNMKSIDLAPLKYFKNLKILQIHGCNKIINFHAINNCTKLEILDLTDCQQMTHKNLEEFTNGENLKVLILSGCINIVDSTFLKNYINLEALKMDRCQNLVYIYSIRHCPNLITVDFSYCNNLYRINDLSFCENIEELYLNGITHLAANHLEFLQDLEGLKTLSLAGWNLDDLYFLENCENLQFLDLSNNKELKSTGQVSFCESLLHLNLSGCSNLIKLIDIENEDVFCENLETINISGCINLSTIHVLFSLENFREIVAYDCSKTITNDLRALRANKIDVESNLLSPQKKTKRRDKL